MGLRVCAVRKLGTLCHSPEDTPCDTASVSPKPGSGHSSHNRDNKVSVQAGEEVVLGHGGARGVVDADERLDAHHLNEALFAHP